MVNNKDSKKQNTEQSQALQEEDKILSSSECNVKIKEEVKEVEVKEVEVKEVEVSKEDASLEEINTPSDLEDLQNKLQVAENTSKDYLDRLQRTLAEFDNFRKRTNTEKASMYENGAINIIEKLLPIYDNFERAITSTLEEDKNSPVFKGLELIYKQFEDLFKSLNIKELEGEGSPFNPNIHNAVMHIEDENFGQNVVAEVLQKGYKYNDKVIRPSMVKVAN